MKNISIIIFLIISSCCSINKNVKFQNVSLHKDTLDAVNKKIKSKSFIPNENEMKQLVVMLKKHDKIIYNYFFKKKYGVQVIGYIDKVKDTIYLVHVERFHDKSDLIFFKKNSDSIAFYNFVGILTSPNVKIKKKYRAKNFIINYSKKTINYQFKFDEMRPEFILDGVDMHKR